MALKKTLNTFIPLGQIISLKTQQDLLQYGAGPKDS